MQHSQKDKPCQHSISSVVHKQMLINFDSFRAVKRTSSEKQLLVMQTRQHAHCIPDDKTRFWSTDHASFQPDRRLHKALCINLCISYLPWSSNVLCIPIAFCMPKFQTAALPLFRFECKLSCRGGLFMHIRLHKLLILCLLICRHFALRRFNVSEGDWRRRKCLHWQR